MHRVPSPLFVLSLVLPLAAQAAGVPLTLTTSGYLLDASDNPMTQQGVALGFSIWTDVSSPAGLSHVWPATGESESACVVGVVNGFYSTVLDGNLTSGCGAGLTSDHLPGTLPRYLQVSVGGVMLSPRMRIGTIPTAALATQSADTQALMVALAAGGASVNAPGNIVDWKALKGVPVGFADEVDADTTYTAATNGGLSLLDQAFSIANGGVTNAMLAQSSVTVTAGAGLTGGGAAALGGATTLALEDLLPSPAGVFSHPTLTVDAKGRITSIASGTVTSGTVTSVGAGAGLTGGPITASGSLAIADGGVTNAMLASDAASLAKVSNGAMTVSGSNVGIGTTTPAEKLAVAGNAVIGGTGTMELYEGFGAQQHRTLTVQGDPAGLIGLPGMVFASGGRTTHRTYAGSLTWASSDYASAEKRSALISVYNSGTNFDEGNMTFFTRNGNAGALTEQLRITASGNVGIGTSTPASDYRLDVSGNLRTSGYLGAAGQPWFYAHSGGSNPDDNPSWANYSGFVPWGSTISGSTNFTTNTTASGGFFTVPVTGVYFFSAAVLNYPTATPAAQMAFSVDGATSEQATPAGPGAAGNFGFTRGPLAAQQVMHTTATMKLNAGQIVRVSVDTIYLFTAGGHAFFTGHLLFATD